MSYYFAAISGRRLALGDRSPDRGSGSCLPGLVDRLGREHRPERRLRLVPPKPVEERGCGEAGAR